MTFTDRLLPTANRQAANTPRTPKLEYALQSYSFKLNQTYSGFFRQITWRPWRLGG
jgi:hypothetical protein